MSPLPPQTLISNQLNHLAKHGGIRWEHVPASMATFNLHLNVCGKDIVWQVEYQLLGADWYPDFIYADDFNPLLPVPNLPSLGALLVKWSMHNQRALYDLLKAMRSRFSLYQRELIEGEGAYDPALNQNLAILLDSCPDAEILYVPDYPKQAVLTVRLPEVDLSFLNDFFSIAWGFKEPQKVAARLASKIRLKILYPISMGAAPTAHLNLPPELYSILGDTRLPDWNRGMDVGVFLDGVTKAIHETCIQAGEAAEARRQLLLALAATKLGEPAELDMAGSRSAMFQMNVDGLEWILFVEIATSFPAVQPALRLQENTEIMYNRTFQEYPWSPRWPPKEMATRIYTFIEQTILDLE